MPNEGQPRHQSLKFEGMYHFPLKPSDRWRIQLQRCPRQKISLHRVVFPPGTFPMLQLRAAQKARYCPQECWSQGIQKWGGRCLKPVSALPPKWQMNVAVRHQGLHSAWMMILVESHAIFQLGMKLMAVSMRQQRVANFDWEIIFCGSRKELPWLALTADDAESVAGTACILPEKKSKICELDSSTRELGPLEMLPPSTWDVDNALWSSDADCWKCRERRAFAVIVIEACGACGQSCASIRASSTVWRKSCWPICWCWCPYAGSSWKLGWDGARLSIMRWLVKYRFIVNIMLIRLVAFIQPGIVLVPKLGPIYWVCKSQWGVHRRLAHTSLLLKNGSHRTRRRAPLVGSGLLVRSDKLCYQDGRDGEPQSNACMHGRMLSLPGRLVALLLVSTNSATKSNILISSELKGLSVSGSRSCTFSIFSSVPSN